MTAPGLNQVELVGDLATNPEVKTFDSGIKLMRLLVCVRVEQPRRRVDVVPVTVWEPSADLEDMLKGERVSIVGSIQRRYWDQADGRRSRMEVVAHEVAWWRKGGVGEVEVHFPEEVEDDVREELNVRDQPEV